MRRATITTTHDDEAIAARIAAAVAPDNTAEMETRVDGDRIVTTVERDSTGGLRSTVDDYVVNATVATRLADDRTAVDADVSVTANDTPANDTPANDRPADDRPADDRPADGRPADDAPANDTLTNDNT